MRVQILQHVPFEGPGTIAPFFQRLGSIHQLQIVHLYRGEQPLPISDYDLMVVMGGPMSVHDEQDHPWLVAEKHAIAQAIEADRSLLGICLGAQLIADVLGAEVRPMGYREIGWHPVQTDSAWRSAWGAVLPDQFMPLHWHGDTFAIPSGAVPLGSSQACANQGFVYGDRVLGLQFHLEFDARSVRRLARAAAQELDQSTYVQSETQMLVDERRFADAHRHMDVLLQRLSALARTD